MFKSESIILEFTVWEFYFWILLDKLLLKLKVLSTSDFQKSTALYTKENKHKKERKEKKLNFQKSVLQNKTFKLYFKVSVISYILEMLCNLLLLVQHSLHPYIICEDGYVNESC